MTYPLRLPLFRIQTCYLPQVVPAQSRQTKDVHRAEIVHINVNIQCRLIEHFYIHLFQIPGRKETTTMHLMMNIVWAPPKYVDQTHEILNDIRHHDI